MDLPMVESLQLPNSKSLTLDLKLKGITMPTLKRDLLSTIRAKDIAKLAKSGEELLTKEYDESVERYHRILRFSRKDIADNDFIKDVYDMLIAFKMNSRGASLSEPADFKKSIKKHVDTIQSLAKYKLETVKANDETFKETIAFLFDNLKLTQINSPLVTFAKTMHFLLPDLFMPIDRRYTLQFFTNRPLSIKRRVSFKCSSSSDCLRRNIRRY